MPKMKRMVNHPGVYIKDAIEALGLSQSEFAYRTGLSIKNVSTIVNGESNVTFDVAVKLASFFNNSVEGWINLQIKYDLWLNEAKKEEEYQKDWEIAKLFDKDFFSRLLGISINSKEKERSIDDLRRCLSVSSLQNLENDDMYAFCKTSVIKDLDTKTVILRNAWISVAENAARNINVNQFNKQIIIDNKLRLRSLTMLRPQEFGATLHDILNKAGIKLVILPYLKGSNVSGVTKWISNENSVMVAVNDCGKDADRIWFTIFHEIGHAMQNHKRHMTISYKQGEIEDKEEKEANEFAKDLLIDKKEYSAFIERGIFSQSSIKDFARMQGVADFIVLGRLQKEEIVPWNKFQNMKKKYTINF